MQIPVCAEGSARLHLNAEPFIYGDLNADGKMGFT